MTIPLRVLGTTLLLLLPVFSCSTSPALVTAEPEACVHRFVNAMANADIEALASLFAPEATVFMPFASLPERLVGREAIRKAFEPVFRDLRSSKQAPPYVRLSPRDLQVAQTGEVSIITFHLGPKRDGEMREPFMLSRRTFVVRQAGDRCEILHLHASNVEVTPADVK